jgi:hypothetical protein
LRLPRSRVVLTKPMPKLKVRKVPTLRNLKRNWSKKSRKFKDSLIKLPLMRPSLDMRLYLKRLLQKLIKSRRSSMRVSKRLDNTKNSRTL